jgi:hypothetical protein
MLPTVLTQLIDRLEEDGAVTPGLFNDQAAWILGAGSFDHADKENRWCTFLASRSALAGEFRDDYERVKALNLELRSRIVLAADEVLPGNIFDWAIEGPGADISKLLKLVMEERNEFSFRVLSQRAAALPVTHRQMAFVANPKNSFSKSLFSGLPMPSGSSTSVALHFGIPIPALRAHIGKLIHSGIRRGGSFVVDAHEHFLLTATALRGEHSQHNNNNCICSTISGGLREAQCPHLGAGTHGTCKGIFRNVFPRVTDETVMKNIKVIIPDLALNLGHPRVTRTHLLDATIWLTQRR